MSYNKEIDGKMKLILEELRDLMKLVPTIDLIIFLGILDELVKGDEVINSLIEEGLKEKPKATKKAKKAKRIKRIPTKLHLIQGGRKN